MRRVGVAAHALQLVSGRADPKPRRRIRATKFKYGQMVDIMLRRFPHCECGCGRRSASVHHVIRRSWGDDVYANFMALAGDGTRGCHGAFTSKQRTWDPDRQQWIDPVEVAYRLRHRMETVRIEVLAYVLEKRGQAWLDRMYPRRPE